MPLERIMKSRQHQSLAELHTHNKSFALGATYLPWIYHGSFALGVPDWHMTCAEVVPVKAVVQDVHNSACFEQRAFVLPVVSAIWVCRNLQKASRF